MKRVILLVQFTESLDSKTYADYDTVPLAVDGICQLYERCLKGIYPTRKNITYDLSDLFKYIDELTSICILVKTQHGSYETHDEKDWIKGETLNHLNAQLK